MDEEQKKVTDELQKLADQEKAPQEEQVELGSPTPLALAVIAAFEKKEPENNEKKIHVNPVIAKFASWYEKVRNAMEYREDEVVLRATIERILKRRLLLGGNAKTAAEPLIRELIWARYLEDEGVPESTIGKVEEIIDVYLHLRFNVLQHRRIKESLLNQWIYHLMSSHLAKLLHPNNEKETINNFMYHVLTSHIQIADEPEETKNAQVYMATRKAFARDDLAFLRFHLFQQYFGELTRENVQHVSTTFFEGYDEISNELTHPLKDKIYSYVKRKTAAFLIFEDVFRQKKGHLESFVKHPKDLENAVYAAAETKYQSISSKVRRAVIRSVIFILLTKVAFAFIVEGTYERIVYGEILWTSILLNTFIPPLLMIIVGLFIRTPGEDNTKRILSYIRALLYEEHPKIGTELVLHRNPEKKFNGLTIVFRFLSIVAFAISFGGIIAILTSFNFNVISQFIFIFFITIVSFLSYRISLTARAYNVGDKQGVFTPLIDFLFMPIVRVGRRLTEGISQVNFFLFLFDFIIETPFKLIFAFFEQWFLYMHSESEEMG